MMFIDIRVLRLCSLDWQSPLNIVTGKKYSLHSVIGNDSLSPLPVFFSQISQQTYCSLAPLWEESQIKLTAVINCDKFEEIPYN